MSSQDLTSRVRTDNILDRIALNISTILFMLTILFVTIQILVRNVINELGTFSITIVWTEPAARMALVIGAFWGAAVASRNREHIAITFPLEKIREKSTRFYLICRIIIGVSSLLYALVIFYGMYQKTTLQWNTNFSGLSAIPGGLIFLSVTIALLIMVLYEGWALVEEFRSDEQSHIEDGKL